MGDLFSGGSSLDQDLAHPDGKADKKRSSTSALETIEPPGAKKPKMEEQERCETSNYKIFIFRVVFRSSSE